MQIDGHTKLCGLIGNPVAHTLSPLIHNTLAELTGISLVYGSFLVDQGKLADAVPGAFALHIHGMNVTVPYKSDVIPLLSEIDELAEKIGAVNTLVRTEDGFKGYNTDMPGLYRAMCSDGMEIANREVLILGAGGAARAVAFLCASKGASHVYLLNRTVSKAQAIVQEIAEKTGCPIVPMSLNNTCDIFEGHIPFIKKTHVILEYGKPIYPKELDKDEKKRIGEHCSNIIRETIHKNQALV